MDLGSTDPKVIAFFYGLLLAALGWFGTAFGLGRKVTKVEEGIRAEVAFIKNRQDSNIEALKGLSEIKSLLTQVKDKQSSYDKTLARIDAFLLTREGEPRFITYNAHDILTKTCQEKILAEVNHLVKDNIEMKERWEAHSADFKTEISKMTDMMHKIALSQATIAGRRRTDPIGEE